MEVLRIGASFYGKAIEIIITVLDSRILMYTGITENTEITANRAILVASREHTGVGDFNCKL